MDNEEKLIEYLKKVEQTQKAIDEKTKKAEVYRDYNLKLFSIIKVGIVSICIFLVLAIFILGGSAVLIVREYFNYEQGITRTITTETDDITGTGNSIILNRSDGANVNGNSN